MWNGIKMKLIETSQNTSVPDAAFIYFQPCFIHPQPQCHPIRIDFFPGGASYLLQTRRGVATVRIETHSRLLVENCCDPKWKIHEISVGFGHLYPCQFIQCLGIVWGVSIVHSRINHHKQEIPCKIVRFEIWVPSFQQTNWLNFMENKPPFLPLLSCQFVVILLPGLCDPSDKFIEPAHCLCLGPWGW